MTNLVESSTWENGIYQIDVTDRVQGGADGVTNTPVRQLANRTRFLYDNKANLDSPTFTGAPRVPTAAAGTSTTQIATTAFVQGVLSSPTFTGTPTAPTAVAADSSLQIATTAFVRTGVIDASNAATGVVGEIQTVTGSSVSLTTASGANLTSLSLSAGDWDIEGVAQFIGATGCIPTLMQLGIHTTSAAFSTFNTYNRLALTFATASTSNLVTPVYRLSVSANTTVYLVAQSIFTGGTQTATGFLRARRVR